LFLRINSASFFCKVSPAKTRKLVSFASKKFSGNAQHVSTPKLFPYDYVLLHSVVEGAGIGSLGRAGVKEIAGYLDSKDNDVSGRHACLDLAFVLFTSLGNDQTKLVKLMGDMSERSVAMVEERIRQKLKGSGGGMHTIRCLLVSTQHLKDLFMLGLSASTALATTAVAPVATAKAAVIPPSAVPVMAPSSPTKAATPKGKLAIVTK